jgi:carbamoyl-phosphate synthase large subunit
VIEFNPRSSRTVPFMSKVTKVPMINLATRAAMGQTLASLGYGTGLMEPVGFTAVKAPVFSFAKITKVDIALGPEMKSTGEVIGIDYHFERALYKAIIASGIRVPDDGVILFTIADKDKQESLAIARGYSELGYRIMATEGTAKLFAEAGIKVEPVGKVSEGSPHILDMIRGNVIRMVVSTLTNGRMPEADGFKIRRSTVEHAIPCLTSLDTARAVLNVLTVTRQRRLIYSMALQDYAGATAPGREMD